MEPRCGAFSVPRDVGVWGGEHYSGSVEGASASAHGDVKYYYSILHAGVADSCSNRGRRTVDDVSHKPARAVDKCGAKFVAF